MAKIRIRTENKNNGSIFITELPIGLGWHEFVVSIYMIGQNDPGSVTLPGSVGGIRWVFGLRFSYATYAAAGSSQARSRPWGLCYRG
jgi:hypothetical protein